VGMLCNDDHVSHRFREGARTRTMFWAPAALEKNRQIRQVEQICCFHDMLVAQRT